MKVGEVTFSMLENGKVLPKPLEPQAKHLSLKSSASYLHSRLCEPWRDDIINWARVGKEEGPVKSEKMIRQTRGNGRGEITRYLYTHYSDTSTAF